MKKHLQIGLFFGLFPGSLVWAAQTPEQRADPSTGQIPNSSPIVQEYYIGPVSSGQTLYGAMVGAVSPNQASLSWYKFTSDGTTPIIFDMYGTSVGFSLGGFGGSNDTELAVYDVNGNHIADNKGSNAPSTGDSNVAPTIPAGAPNPPNNYRQPIDPTTPVYNYHSNSWYASNYNGLANLAFVANPQVPATTNWNQFPILPAGTYFLAVTGYSTYFSGNPNDAAEMDKPSNAQYSGGYTSTSPFGFLTFHAMSGTYQLNERVAGDFDLNGTAGLPDLRLLRVQAAQYLPTQGIPASGYSGTTWVGLPSDMSQPTTELARYDLTGNSRIDNNDIAAYGRYTNQNTSIAITWNNAFAAAGTDPYNPGSAGDGATWDLETSQNFNDTVGSDVYIDGDFVTFNDTNGGHYTVTLNSVVKPGSVTFSNTIGNYTVSGTGSISGSAALIKTGTGKTTISTVNNYTGGTTVSAGTLSFAITGALPVNSALTIAANATATAALHGGGAKVVLQTSSFTIAGASNAWSGKLDLGDNDLIAHNGDLATLTNQIKVGMNLGSGYWTGKGIISSASAIDPTFIRTLGILQNVTTGTTPLYTSFDGVSVSATDVLIKYTYFGDTNLDGVVNGTDYNQIDNAFSTGIGSGWRNGDFNYDGVINGSDYTLIDNAFNRQGGSIASMPLAMTASETTATSFVTAVPEPSSIGLFIGLATLFSKRKRRV